MREFAVTAVVLTTRVGLTPVGIATAPSGAAEHTAGLAPLAQFVVVAISGIVTLPLKLLLRSVVLCPKEATGVPPIPFTYTIVPLKSPIHNCWNGTSRNIPV